MQTVTEKTIASAISYGAEHGIEEQRLLRAIAQEKKVQPSASLVRQVECAINNLVVEDGKSVTHLPSKPFFPAR